MEKLKGNYCEKSNVFYDVSTSYRNEINKIENKSIRILNKNIKKKNIFSNFINKYLTSPSTIFIKIMDDEFSDFFIKSGDILIVDSAKNIENGERIVVSMNGKLSVKIFRIIANISYLQTSDKKYLPLSIEPYIEFKIIGKIAGIIHKR
jgi:SOS-response transcriptional repressor LexA